MRKITSILLLVVALFFLWIAGEMNGPLLSMRSDYHLDMTEPLEDAPPLMVFTTVVLGGFRGLIADILWLRVAMMQEQGKYFELVQLSDWITILEPRNTEVWGFHAWNMAYNVSVMMSDSDDRWRWVQNGIKLLRDEGLLYNKGDSSLYWEIGWLYLDKIGGITDRSHMYYKHQHAKEMIDLLGGGLLDYNMLALDSERVNKMKNEYKLIPEIMRDVDLQYGPLDWRRPETHAIYWAYRGKQHAYGKETPKCDMMINQALKMLVYRDLNPDCAFKKGKDGE